MTTVKKTLRKERTFSFKTKHVILFVSFEAPFIFFKYKVTPKPMAVHLLPNLIYSNGYLLQCGITLSSFLWMSVHIMHSKKLLTKNESSAIYCFREKINDWYNRSDPNPPSANYDKSKRRLMSYWHFDENTTILTGHFMLYKVKSQVLWILYFFLYSRCKLWINSAALQGRIMAYSEVWNTYTS